MFGFLSVIANGATPAPQPPAGSTDSAELQKTIRQYILDHPEVVLESVLRYQQKQQATEQERKHETVALHGKELFQDPASPVAESAQAGEEPVTIVEFFDYRCGYCRKVEDTIAGVAGKPGVRIVYKELPILGPDSTLAAKAALAAEKQGAYQKFHHALLTSPTPVTPDSLDKIAADSGLDVVRLHKDIALPEIQAAIARNSELAEKLGIQATPTFVAGKEIVSGALTPEALQSLIDSAHGKSGLDHSTSGGGR
jgi:protein-disulfide isomerase